MMFFNKYKHILLFSHLLDASSACWMRGLTSDPDLQDNCQQLKRSVRSINENYNAANVVQVHPWKFLLRFYILSRDLPGAKKKLGFSCDLKTLGEFLQRFYIHKFCQLHLGYLHPHPSVSRYGSVDMDCIYNKIYIHHIGVIHTSRCQWIAQGNHLYCDVLYKQPCRTRWPKLHRPSNDACWSSWIMPRQKAKHLHHTDTVTSSSYHASLKSRTSSQTSPYPPLVDYTLKRQLSDCCIISNQAAR